MSVWLAGAIALLAVAMPAAGWIACRGGPVDRLVGVELGSAVTTITLLLLAQAAGQSSYLIVPLVLAVVSFAGTLVYTRLLAPRP